jgi:hypothetical protein
MAKVHTFETELNRDDRSPVYMNGWLRLAAAILARAALEARDRGDLGACGWLRSEDSKLYAELTGIDPLAILKNVDDWEKHPGGAVVVRVLEGQL